MSESDRRIPALVRADAQLRSSETGGNLTAPMRIILVVGALAVGGILSVFAPKPEESVFEQRTLAKMPSPSPEAVMDGSFEQEFEAFYADTFPLRDTLVKTAARVEECYGIRAEEGRIHTVSDAGGTQPVDPPLSVTKPPVPEKEPAPAVPDKEEEKQETSSTASFEEEEIPPEDEDVQFTPGNSVFVYRKEALSLFGEGSGASAEYYTEQLNAWQETMGDDVTIYNLIVPTHIEFVSLPERLKGLSDPQKPNIDRIYAGLDPRIRRVDAWSSLNEHRDEYLYFHTDHHWTGLGAYYAYTAYCSSAGLVPVSLGQMEKRSIEDVLGSLYAQTQDSDLLSNLDTVEYWIPPVQTQVTQYAVGSPFYGFDSALFAEGAKSYSVFLGGDYPLTKIVTDVPNGRKLAVVKESFGNAIVPFLAGNYSEIYVIDQRYFERNLPEFLRENDVKELLFINNIFAANTTVRIREIDRLRTQVWSPPAEEEAAS